ncbi:MAG TPA: adenylosuccinate lyase [Candidatus Paceibacterota bacterium]
MELNKLTAVSSIDGRYRGITAPLSEYFSEFALMRARIRVEMEYLIALSEAGLVRKFTDEEKSWLRNSQSFTLEHAEIIKKIEKEGYGNIPATNHDVKAVEYFITGQLGKTSLSDVSGWVHFALTSEDVDNIAQAVLLRGAIESVLSPAARELTEKLEALINEYADTAMLARTHGQPASPTTFGKEIKIYLERFRRQVKQVANSSILVKFAGATGNYNAQIAAAPEIDWQNFSKEFVERFNKDGSPVRFELNPFAAQTEPHDTYAELFDALRRGNTVLIDFAQDMWRYISDGWISQKPKEGEVGSSTMPHKVNPIDFENAEGNLEVANSFFELFSRVLPVSRLQRDLSDSTIKRNFGTAFAHTLIAYKSLLRGLGKIDINKEAMLSELQAHPEVLAEAIQTILRREGVAMPYEKLKQLTRGRQVSLEDFAKFIDELPVSGEVKNRLKALRPENYIGLAAEIARKN